MGKGIGQGISGMLGHGAAAGMSGGGVPEQLLQLIAQLKGGR
jgi:hypothetical protein